MITQLRYKDFNYIVFEDKLKIVSSSTHEMKDYQLDYNGIDAGIIIENAGLLLLYDDQSSIIIFSIEKNPLSPEFRKEIKNTSGGYMATQFLQVTKDLIIVYDSDSSLLIDTQNLEYTADSIGFFLLYLTDTECILTGSTDNGFACVKVNKTLR